MAAPTPDGGGGAAAIPPALPTTTTTPGVATYAPPDTQVTTQGVTTVAPTVAGTAVSTIPNAPSQPVTAATIPQAPMMASATPAAVPASAVATPTSVLPPITAPTSTPAPVQPHAPQFGGKHMAVMQRTAGPADVQQPSTPAPSPVAPVQPLNGSHSGKQPSMLPAPSHGGKPTAMLSYMQGHGSGKPAAALAHAQAGVPQTYVGAGQVQHLPPPQQQQQQQQQMVAPPQIVQQPQLRPYARLSAPSEDALLRHALPKLQAIAQEFDPEAVLSPEVAMELLRSTQPLIRSIAGFAARLARRRDSLHAQGPPSRRVIVEKDDLEEAVGSLYPHLNTIGGATPAPLPPSTLPTPEQAQRVALKKQRLGENGAAAVTAQSTGAGSGSGSGSGDGSRTTRLQS